MSTLVKLRWKLRQGVAPGASDRQDDLFKPDRIRKVEPSSSGPSQDDAEIKSRVLYDEFGSQPVEYHCTHTVDEIETLANTPDA